MANRQKQVAIFGATGSVGHQALDLVMRHGDQFQVSVLAAGSDVKGLTALAKKFKPQHVAIADEGAFMQLKAELSGTNIEVHCGMEAMSHLARLEADVVVSAIAGIAGLPVTMAAVEAGRIVAIANKEPLVSAGGLIKAAAALSGAKLLPIDSEHNAIFQAWTSERKSEINGITLTASGGAFWGWSKEDLATVTPSQAIKHPHWPMGNKISVDSATMMNKGLEVIEAAELFDLSSSQINVLVHPSSIVHGIVHYCDGSSLAQMGAADMRVPIAYALAWPERLEWDFPPLQLDQLSDLHFELPRDDVFPSLSIARTALDAGGLAPAILNAANEKAVELFLAGQIGFFDIYRLIHAMIDTIEWEPLTGLDAVIAKDIEVRQRADIWLAE